MGPRARPAASPIPIVYPQLYFYGEESSLGLRLWTWGYNLYKAAGLNHITAWRLSGCRLCSMAAGSGRQIQLATSC